MTVTRIIYFLGSVNVLWSVIKALENGVVKYRYPSIEKKYNIVDVNFTLVVYNVQTEDKGLYRCEKNYRKLVDRFPKLVQESQTLQLIVQETVNSATYTEPQSTSTQATGNPTKAFLETVTSATYTEPQSSSSQAIGNSTEAGTVTSATYTEPQSLSTRAIGNSTEAEQSEGNKLVIYIAVPVSFGVLLVFVLTVTVLILRRKLNQNEDGLHAIYQTTANSATGDNDHNYDAVDRTGDIDHNYDAVDRTVNLAHNYDAVDRTGDSDHNYYSINQTRSGDRYYNNIDEAGSGDRNYSNFDQTGSGDRNYNNIERSDNGSAIQYDDSGYLNLKITA